MVKNEIKKRIYAARKIRVNRIIEKIKKYQVVSFDVFDTVLKRDVSKPERVFSIIQNVLDERKIEIGDFAAKRIMAEKIARSRKNAEVSLEDIYNCFEAMDNETKKKVYEVEIEVELEIVSLNKDIAEVYEFCIENGKRVFFISDMYLPKNTIVEMLKRNGIIRYEALYLSNDLNATKKEGLLYDVFLQENNLHANQVIHIGDAIKGDFIMARKKRLKTVFIPRNNIRLDKSTYNLYKRMEMEDIGSFINNHIDNEQNEYFKFGYSKYGVLLYGFSAWLYAQLKRDGITKVYFFSRDGWIMKRAFEACGYSTKIKTQYLEVSRRSLRVPILWLDCSLKTVINTLSPAKQIHINSIFSGVGLDINEYKEVICKYGFSVDSVFDRNVVTEKKEIQLLFEEIREDIINLSKKEYINLHDYLKEQGVCGKFAVVDIGWSGGMQRYLTQALEQMGIDSDIYGYYFGIADFYTRNTAVLPTLKLKGYLFDYKNDLNPKDTRSSFVGLFETLFLEQRGSVKKYVHKENGVVAERYPYEYRRQDEELEEGVQVKNIQEGAVKFLEDINLKKFLKLTIYTKEQIFEAIRQVGAAPTKKDIEMFGNFRFMDDGAVAYLAKPDYFFLYCIRPGKLKRDFLESRWKVGFMKRLLKIKLPYEKIYMGLRKYK